jgi:diguanylate cyclase
MPYEIVHTIGSTAYFVFFTLFLWISRVPRTNPGAGWWAAAMFFALSARLALLALISQRDSQFAVLVYASLNVVEKLFLVVGLVKFFNLPVRLQWFFAATLAIEVLLLVRWAGYMPPSLRGIGSSVFNASFLMYAAWVTYKNRSTLHSHLLLVTSGASALLAAHWLTASTIIKSVPSWLVHGFLLGTILVVIQYFSLLAAVLFSFQKRLLEAESKALDMAFEDPLTGLNNKRYMTTLFNNAMALSARSHQLVAVIYIDLDNFKPINDRAGHAVGDEVLRVVARRLKKSTRTTDICARIGGDEFVVMCTQLEQPEQVHEIANKLLGELTSVITISGSDYVLGASMGISLSPLHGNSLVNLLEYADNAMYQVKRGGKNTYRIYEMNPKVDGIQT